MGASLSPGADDAGDARPRLTLALTIAALLHWPLFVRPLQDLDEPNFASIAALCHAGGTLYRDGGVDNKPPGIFWVYELGFALGGRYAMVAVHLLCLAAVLGTTLLLGKIGQRIGGARVGFYSALGYGIFSMACDPRSLAANTENFMALPLAFAMWLLVRDDASRPRLFVVGAAIAVACLFKQVAVVTLGVVALAALLPPDVARRRRGGPVAELLGCGCGFVAVFAVVAALLATRHALGDAVQWTVFSLVSHYGRAAWAEPAGRQLVDALASVALFVGTALPICVAAARASRRPSRHGRAGWLVVAWLGLSALGVTAGGHFSDHYFIQLLSPVALLAGLELGARPRRSWNVALGAFAVALMLFAALVDPITFRPFWQTTRPDYRALAAAIDARTRPDERIFVWGNAPAIYVLADRLPASRFVGFLRGLRRSEGQPPEAAWDAGPVVWSLLAEDFARHPPALIIDTATGDYREFGHYPLRRFPALQALVDAGYVRDSVVEGATLYRRR